MTSRPPAQAATAVSGEARLHRLLDAHRAITEELALEAVLRQVVATACDLVGAPYGALGVLSEDGVIEHFVQRGMDESTAARMGSLPRRRGFLGAVLTESGAVRLNDLTLDPRAVDFLSTCPALRSFLGVPIRARGVAFGELYLAHSEPGQFDADDEELVLSLAAMAGTAIDNARLYDEARRSRDWLNASGEVARALLADAEDEVVLEIVTRALRVAEADYAALILPTEDGRLHVTQARGLGSEIFQDMVFDPEATVFGKAILGAEAIRTHDMMLWTDVDFENRFKFGPAMLAPIVDAEGSRGAVVMLRTADRRPFSAHEVELACTFADQVALAVQLNNARADAEWLRVLEVRNRIAEDLHDNVIQRLFAIGMGIQSLNNQVLNPEVAGRLHRHVTELDETIDQIRSRVFGLRDDGDSSPPRHTRVPSVRRAPRPQSEPAHPGLHLLVASGHRPDDGAEPG